MKKVNWLLLAISFYAFGAFGQDYDEGRMQRDLKVLDKLAREYFEEKGSKVYGQRSGSLAQYVSGFGILLEVPSSSKYSFSFGQGSVISTGSRVIFPKSSNNEVSTIYHNGNSLVWGQASSSATSPSEKIDLDSAKAATKDAVVGQLKEFLYMYGDMASQLKVGEKFMVVYEPGNTGLGIVGYNNGSVQIWDGKEGSPSKITVQASQRDIMALRNKQINKEQFFEKVKVDTQAAEGTDRSEYSILGNILDDVVSESWVELMINDKKDSRFFSFTNYGDVSYTYLEDLGAVYELQLQRVGYTNDRGRFKGWDNLNDEEKKKYDQQMEQAYPEIIQEAGEVMVEYGRTLRNLKSGESVILNLYTPGCFDCDLPARTELVLSKSDIEKYESRKLSLDQAIKTIKTTKEGKAKDNQGRDRIIFRD